MKTHYMMTTVSAATACGLPTRYAFAEYPATTVPEEITCKSCIRCFDSYVERHTAAIEQLAQTSNEELLVAVIENALGLWNGYHSVKVELVNSMQTLLQRLVEVGFITEPDKILIDWYYE